MVSEMADVPISSSDFILIPNLPSCFHASIQLGFLIKEQSLASKLLYNSRQRMAITYRLFVFPFTQSCDEVDVLLQ